MSVFVSFDKSTPVAPEPEPEPEPEPKPEPEPQPSPAVPTKEVVFWGCTDDGTVFYKAGKDSPWEEQAGKSKHVHVSGGGSHIMFINSTCLHHYIMVLFTFFYFLNYALRLVYSGNSENLRVISFV